MIYVLSGPEIKFALFPSINSLFPGRLHYIQAISNQTTDSFVFDVTNGISRLSDLVFHFTILPKTLYIETRELVVTEGATTILKPVNLHIITGYYEDKIEDYLVTVPPSFGRLEINGSTATIFSVLDLEAHKIKVGLCQDIHKFLPFNAKENF